MKKESIVGGVIGLLAGVILAGFVAGQAVNDNNASMMRLMGMRSDKPAAKAADHGTMSMQEMSRSLERLKGDEFDKSFIELMIDHHEGAVEMARLAESRAQHDEIKQLSKDIITAQEKEIAEMKQWQKDWGYSGGEMMEMRHGSN